jgi:hypothetical protein
MNLSLKIQLNHNRKFQSNWDVPLVLLERSRREGFNEISFLWFGLRMWEILNFKWFLSLKIQINCKKNHVLEGKIKRGTFSTDFSIQVRGNWDVPLVFLERSQWTWFNGIYFVSFGLRMWFWKESSVE